MPPSQIDGHFGRRPRQLRQSGRSIPARWLLFLSFWFPSVAAMKQHFPGGIFNPEYDLHGTVPFSIRCGINQLMCRPSAIQFQWKRRRRFIEVQRSTYAWQKRDLVSISKFESVSSWRQRSRTPYVLAKRSTTLLLLGLEVTADDWLVGEVALVCSRKLSDLCPSLLVATSTLLIDGRIDWAGTLAVRRVSQSSHNLSSSHNRILASLSVIS